MTWKQGVGEKLRTHQGGCGIEGMYKGRKGEEHGRERAVLVVGLDRRHALVARCLT